MIVIACLDDNDGMMFNGRRQSQDRYLRARIVEMVSDARLWMNHYSASQFDPDIPHLNIDEAFLREAVDGDFCFVENVPVAPYERWIEKVIIFRWNRTYPADQSLDLPLIQDHWRKVETSEFAGHSHELITMEVYMR